jgi:hypothetical protein
VCNPLSSSSSSVASQNATVKLFVIPYEVICNLNQPHRLLLHLSLNIIQSEKSRQWKIDLTQQQTMNLRDYGICSDSVSRGMGIKKMDSFDFHFLGRNEMREHGVVRARDNVWMRTLKPVLNVPISSTT